MQIIQIEERAVASWVTTDVYVGKARDPLRREQLSFHSLHADHTEQIRTETFELEERWTEGKTRP